MVTTLASEHRDPSHDKNLLITYDYFCSLDRAKWCMIADISYLNKRCNHTETTPSNCRDRMRRHNEERRGMEWNAQQGPLTKVIPRKIFLDMVPSFLMGIIPAMRGQPKRLSRNYLRRNGGSVVVDVQSDFVSQQRCFLRSQPSFYSAGLSFVLCLFGCSLFSRLFRFKELN